ncbi:MAG: hypothetical protein ACXADB_10750, partial [Candidatus Hermodarchaeia archaeon]
MKNRFPILIVIFLLLSIASVSTTSSKIPTQTPFVPSPQPYTGLGTPMDVYEFIHNHSSVQYNAYNTTTFSYLADWYPSSYRGYQLHADIQNVRKTENPLPNGDFELYPETGNNWTVTDTGAGLISSVSNTSGGNPGSCLDIELMYGKLPSQMHAQIENNFEYISSISPDSLTLYFDIQMSPDITIANWLVIEVSVETGFGTTVANWVTTTNDFHPNSWTTLLVPSLPVNGSLVLKIDISKTTTSNLDVDGHIYFDNFNYQIGSFASPTEVGLTLNGTAVEDTFGSYGEVDIYADPVSKQEVDLSNAWSTTQLFAFNSSYSISFDFEYYVGMKSENPSSALTSFLIEPNSYSLWKVNYTVPIGRPPTGFSHYQFGFYLHQGWQLLGVRDNSGLTVLDFSFNSSTRIFLLDETIAASGDRFTIFTQGSNYVTEVYIQKSDSSDGPWENMTESDYLLTGEYMRVFGELGPIESTGNIGSVSIFLPNGTEWILDSNPTIDTSLNTLESQGWQIPSFCGEFAGSDYRVLVSFLSGSQCGLSDQVFTTMNQAQITIITPLNNSEIGWEEFRIAVNVQDMNSGEIISEATVRLSYTNPQGQIQFVEMSYEDQGVYSTIFSPGSYSAESTINFYVEFFKPGYVNTTYVEGTATHFYGTVNTGVPLEVELFNQIIVYGILFAILVFSTWLLYSKVYQSRYVKPRQLAHEKKLQEVLTIYNDVTNLSRFLVLNRESGIALFDTIGESGSDGSLIGGFLQAIQAFSIDVNEEQRSKDTAQLSEIAYEGFRVLINDGNLVRTAIVYRGTPSETLREKLDLFTKRFEGRYQKELIDHGHEPHRFRNTTELLEELFHISLLFPHRVEPKSANVPLSNLESRLHFVALELSKQQESVYLSKIVNTYL